MDVGSDREAVVIDAATDAILWSDYQRHGTPKQPEKVLEFCQRFETEIAGFECHAPPACFVTGSGGNGLTKYLGGKLRAGSQRRLAGRGKTLSRVVAASSNWVARNAKIIIFKTDPETGRKKKMPSMNDKCAGGHRRVIDRSTPTAAAFPRAALRDGLSRASNAPSRGRQVRRCSAETDINGLKKMGVPRRVDGSLFEAIVMQNLSVLRRQYICCRWCCCWRPQLLHSRHARLLEGQHPRSGKSAAPRSPKHPPSRPD